MFVLFCFSSAALFWGFVHEQPQPAGYVTVVSAFVHPDHQPYNSSAGSVIPLFLDQYRCLQTKQKFVYHILIAAGRTHKYLQLQLDAHEEHDHVRSLTRFVNAHLLLRTCTVDLGASSGPSTKTLLILEQVLMVPLAFEYPLEDEGDALRPQSFARKSLEDLHHPRLYLDATCLLAVLDVLPCLGPVVGVVRERFEDLRQHRKGRNFSPVFKRCLM